MDSNLSSMVYGSLILIGLVVGVFVLWNLGVFNISGSEYIGGGYATGFDRIKHPYTISYINRSFTALFTNHYKTAIRIKNVSAHEYISDEDCFIENSSYPAQIVGAGGVFNVSASCSQMSDGDSYEMGLTLNYSVLNGGAKTDYSDSGIIKAQA
jgi:hypothetical protein